MSMRWCAVRRFTNMDITMYVFTEPENEKRCRLISLSQAQEYRLEDRVLPSGPGHHQYLHSVSNLNLESQLQDLRRHPLPILPPPRDDHAGLAQLARARFELTSSDQYKPQIPQLSFPPELPPVSYSPPASPSAGSLMLSFWNTNTGHDINDGHAPTYASPPSFGQAVPLFNSSSDMIPSRRRASGDNSNDPKQLFAIPPGSLTKTISQRTRGPRPLPPKPVPHDASQQSSMPLPKQSPAVTPPESKFVARPVDQAPQEGQAFQIRPLPTWGPSVPASSSRRGEILGPETSKSASYATSSFSPTAQPPGGIRHASAGNWGWKPPSLAGSTSQTWGTGPRSSVCPIHVTRIFLIDSSAVAKH